MKMHIVLLYTMLDVGNVGYVFTVGLEFFSKVICMPNDHLSTKEFAWNVHAKGRT